MKLKDRAKDKADRLAARRNGSGDTKGPQIAWDQPGGVPPADDNPAPVTPGDDDAAPGDGTDDE